MAKAVTYSVVPRVNPSDRDSSPKYYAQAQARGSIGLREMSDRIQQNCTVTKADVYAVLVAFEDIITDALRNGEIVRLGDLGTLRIGLNGKGAATEKEFDVSLIKRAKINFRPGVALAGILGSLSYAKVAKKSAEEEGAEVSSAAVAEEPREA